MGEGEHILHTAQGWSEDDRFKAWLPVLGLEGLLWRWFSGTANMTETFPVCTEGGWWPPS